MNPDQLRRRFATVLRRWKPAWDASGRPPAQLLEDLAGIAGDHAIDVAIRNAPEGQPADEVKQWDPSDITHAGEMIGWLLGHRASFHHPGPGTGTHTLLAIRTADGEQVARPGDLVIRRGRSFSIAKQPDGTAPDPKRTAEQALNDHKARCERCLTPRRQMCPTGDALLNHLRDCGRTRHDARRRQPPAQPTALPAGHGTTSWPPGVREQRRLSTETGPAGGLT